MAVGREVRSGKPGIEVSEEDGRRADDDTATTPAEARAARSYFPLISDVASVYHCHNQQL